MHRGVSNLPVRFQFSQGRPNNGTFSAPDLGALNIPLRGVRLGRVLHWELVGDATTTVFDAKTEGDTISGTFKEQGRPTGSFMLRRTPERSANAYVTKATSFSNGRVTLAGSVFVPRSAGKHAAVVLLQGSGAEGRWATAYIADFLARRGIVALSYDKRGVGESTGDWRTATMEDLVGDGRAAVESLAKRGDVDRARLGLYGHSQGGELVPAIAASDSNVKWLIAADGPVGPAYLQDLFRVDTSLARSITGHDIVEAEKLYAEFIEVARTGASHTRLRSDMTREHKAAWLDRLAIPDETSWIWNWYRKVGNYDNSTAWATVHVPVLLVFGAEDQLVPVRETIATTTRLLKDGGNRRVGVRVFPGADHTLHVPPTDRNGWPRNAPGFLDAIASFAEHAP